MPNVAIPTGSMELGNMLREMVNDGDFAISVLTDENGFPIASAVRSEQNTEMLAAVVAVVQRIAHQIKSQLAMGQIDEIAVCDETNRTLICRPFLVREHRMILGVMLAHRKQAYRRLSNKAVRSVKDSWKLL